jgi:integrase
VAIVILYTTGLRRGELVRLILRDYDQDERALLVRDSKFHKSAWCRSQQMAPAKSIGTLTFAAPVSWHVRLTAHCSGTTLDVERRIPAQDSAT